jgi:hypothetical protein
MLSRWRLAWLLAACWLLNGGMLVWNAWAGRWWVVPLNLLGLGLLLRTRMRGCPLGQQLWQEGRLLLALRVFWCATLVSRRCGAPDCPPWLAMRVGVPLVRALCWLACRVGPRGKDEG